MPSVYDELERRGLVAQASDPSLREMLARGPVTLYVGFDPTADSLHLGHLVPIMCAAHLQRAGHRVIVLVGGATGMVGDPSGRSDERNLLSPEEVARNVKGQKAQMRQFVSFEGENPAVLVNNADWIAKMSFVDWLRDVGKYFTVNYMLAKDSVKSRLGSESGISFTEFSYMTMQAYDFLHLHDEHGCTLQCGGNDQWGNITAGIDLVRRLRGAQVYGLTFPLVTAASGEKFGKSAGNAVWLDAARTSRYDFYQYWIRTDDRDVARYLNYFTFLGAEEIAGLEEKLRAAPEEREAHKRLAWEVTALVHGEQAAAAARRESEAHFGAGSVADMSDEERADVLSDATSATMPREMLKSGMALPRLMRQAGLAQSSSAASGIIRGGGAYLNNERVTEPNRVVTEDDLANGVIELRAGRKKRIVIRFE